jgi:uncharacterized phage-associated protein
MLRAIEAAEYLIWLAHENEDPITNLKLQKLMYYAQGFSLAKLGQPLFDGQIVAWQHGPVVKEIYEHYKGYKSDPLPVNPIRHNRYKGHEKEILEKVYELYGKFSGWALRNITHEEPIWKNAQENETISPAKLKEYFITRADVYPLIVPVHSKTWDEISDRILEDRKELWVKMASL